MSRQKANQKLRFFSWMTIGFLLIIVTRMIIWLISIIRHPPQDFLTQIISPSVCPQAIYAFATTEKLVALTIDDGPDLRPIPAKNSLEKSNNSTWNILKTLQENGAKATFFLISEEKLAQREKNREKKLDSLTEQMVSQGHEIANHLTRDRASIVLGEKFETELKLAHQRLEKYVEPEENLRWFRPGVGWCTLEMQKVAWQNGYKTVLGSVWPYDTISWVNSQFTTKFIEENISPGSIIILHDGGKRGDRTVETLEKVLKTLKKKGYKFVTLSEMDARAKPVPVPAALQGTQESFRRWLILIIEKLRRQ